MRRVLCDSLVSTDPSPLSTIMTCKISPESDFLAVGDTQGSLNVYKINEERKLSLATKMKAHQVHHDWMKKREIEPAIGCIAWLNRCGNHNKLITTNGVVVKMWKLKYLSFKESHKTSSFLQNLPSHSYQWSQVIEFPKLHLHMIDSLSLSHNEEYMISSDGCSMMKWNMEKPNKPFIINIPESTTVLDFSSTEDESEEEKEAREEEETLWDSIKPATVAKFCHRSDNRFVYASKYGDINYIDMRASNSIAPSLKLKQKKKPNLKNIQHYISVMSDVDFPEDQNIIASRDYLYSYIWDLRKPQIPVFKAAVFSSINNQICEMYQQSKIFDRSQILVSSDCSHLITNHYQDSFHDISVNQKRNFRYRHEGNNSVVTQIKSIDKNYPPMYETEVLNYIDYNQKSGVLVGCTKNNIYLYDEKKYSDQEQSSTNKL